MQKLVYVFILMFLVSSCLPNFGLKSKNVSKVASWGVLELTSTWDLDEMDEESDLTWALNDETSSWVSQDNPENTKVLSMEAQYCKAKWWKVEILNEKETCFITDEIWLLKCDVSVFYLDKCRDKSAIIKDGVVVSLPKREMVIDWVKTWTSSVSLQSNNILLNKQEEKKNYTETNLWSWFTFRVDDTYKYLYLWDKLITKVEKSGKIMMWLNNWDIYPFDVYVDKTDAKPTKIVNVNIINKTFTEKSTWFVSLVKTSSWTAIENNSFSSTKEPEKNTAVDTKPTITSKTQVWLTWTYYMSWQDLVVKTSSWTVKTIFSWNWWIVVDYELLVNKQVKISYFTTENVKSEKIVDLTKILDN